MMSSEPAAFLHNVCVLVWFLEFVAALSKGIEGSWKAPEDLWCRGDSPKACKTFDRGFRRRKRPVGCGIRQ